MSTRLSVALVSSEYPPDISGGVGVHGDHITASLEKEVNHELFIPHSGNYPGARLGSRIHEVVVADSTGELDFWLRFCHATVRSVKKAGIRPQIISCHDWMTVLAGIRLRHLLRTPLVFHVHLPRHGGYRGCLEDLGLVVADIVVVNSQDIRDELIGRRLPIRRIEVVPNGVDSSEFKPGPNWPNDKGYILFVGRLVAQKGIDVLLRAFALVLHRCPRSRLVIVGDGDLELYLRRLVRYLGIPHRVHFVDWQTGSALVTYYQQARIVVIPSYYEPFGLVALEAMACGRPVVGSRTGGLSEIIEDGVQGYLVAPGDYVHLAQRVTRLILDSALRREMGQSARQRTLRFSWDSTASRTINLYESLIGHRVGPNPVRVIHRISQYLFFGYGAAVKLAMLRRLLGVKLN